MEDEGVDLALQRDGDGGEGVGEHLLVVGGNGGELGHPGHELLGKGALLRLRFWARERGDLRHPSLGFS